MNMFVEPKKKNEAVINEKVSHATQTILNEYSEYTGYELGELIDIIASKLLDDEKFVEHFKGKRYNKKIMKIHEQHLKAILSDFIDLEDDDF